MYKFYKKNVAYMKNTYAQSFTEMTQMYYHIFVKMRKLVPTQCLSANSDVTFFRE